MQSGIEMYSRELDQANGIIDYEALNKLKLN